MENPSEPTFSSDGPGLKEAAAEVAARRPASEPAKPPGPGDPHRHDDIEAETGSAPAVDPEEAITARQGAEELARYRAEKAATREQFRREVLGEPTEADIAAEAAKADRAASDAAIADVERRAAELGQPVSGQSPPPFGIEQQMLGQAASTFEGVRSQIVNELLTSFPEITDAQAIANLQQTDPLRFQQLVQSYQEGEQTLGIVKSALDGELLKARDAHQQQFQSYAAEQDALFQKLSPELRTAEHRQAAMKMAVDYLHAMGLDDQEIAASWNGVGHHNYIRDARAQHVLLQAARRHAAEQSLKTRPRPSVPPPQRPGAARDTQPSQDGVTAAERKFHNTGSVRDAARLLIARREARRQ